MSNHEADQSSGYQLVDEFNALTDSMLQGNPAVDQSSDFQMVNESGEITDSMLQGNPDESFEDSQTYEAWYNPDIMTDYFLQQFEIATQLMLNLPNENGRQNLFKLMNEYFCTKKKELRTILKLFLFFRQCCIAYDSCQNS